MIRDGRIDRYSFTPANLNDIELRSISEKIVLIDNGLTDPNALSPQNINLQTVNGQTFELDIPATIGHPDNPLTHDDQIEKIACCLQTDNKSNSPHFKTKAEELLQMKENTLLGDVVAKLRND